MARLRVGPRDVVVAWHERSRGVDPVTGASIAGLRAVRRWREGRVYMDDELAAEIFALGDHVGYVAFGEGQAIATFERNGLANASEAVSDRFEELLVNPTLVTLARQREASSIAGACATSSR